MIQKMKKLTALVFHKEYTEFLNSLQSLGVVHVQCADAQGADNIEVAGRKEQVAGSRAQVLGEKEAKLALIEKTLEKMAPAIPETPENPATLENPASPEKTADEVVAEYEALNEQIQHAKHDIQRTEGDIATLQPWGEFSHEDIARLAEAGYEINYFSCQAKAFNPEWTEQYNATEIANVKGRLFFVTITKKGAGSTFGDGQNVEQGAGISADKVVLPTESLSTLTSNLQTLTSHLQTLTSKLSQLAASGTPVLEKAAEKLQREIEFDKVVLKTAQLGEGRLMVLEGWFPTSKEADVKAFLDTVDTYSEVRDPQPEDNVPILLKNNCWTRMYECLTKMYGSPKYDEFDPTPIVAPFFTLFFAICMGDSGYGLLLMLIGWAIWKDKLKIEMFRGLGPLIISLGVATAVVGFFLGTFFGMDLTTLSFIPEAWRGSVIEGNGIFLKGELAGYDVQMVMAIVIGVFHLCLAMVVKAIVYTKNQGLVANISTWGWLVLVLGSVITGILVLCHSVSESVLQIIVIAIGVVSALAIFILRNPKSNPLINIGAGVWDAYGMVTGLGGDVLSYIRLYALGLAGGMLGAAFNSLGLMVMGDQPNAGTWIGAIVIFILGHVLNLAMSALGAFVHPLRLTFVEYFKNSGYEGTGTEYKPFKG